MDSKEHTINIQSLLGSDIRSRSGCATIRKAINDTAMQSVAVVIDFTGVVHISRSFADELCEILDNTKTLNHPSVRGMSDTVSIMYRIVSEGRRCKRIRNEAKGDIETFADMESLSKFLSTV